MIGSVFLDSNLASAFDVAVNDREVCVNGYLYFCLKATASGYEMIGLIVFLRLPPSICCEMSYCSTLKVFAPIEAKSDESVFSRAAVNVKMPTKAQIPRPMINTVRIVRSNCVLIEPIAIRTFSLNNFSIFKFYGTKVRI